MQLVKIIYGVETFLTRSINFYQVWKKVKIMIFFMSDLPNDGVSAKRKTHIL